MPIKVPTFQSKQQQAVRAQQEKAHADRSGRYYDYAWRKLRGSFIRENSLCAECLRSETIREADVVDHIIPVRIEPELRLDAANLQSLCHHHHNIKTAQEKLKYGPVLSGK